MYRGGGHLMNDFSKVIRCLMLIFMSCIRPSINLSGMGYKPLCLFLFNLSTNNLLINGAISFSYPYRYPTLFLCLHPLNLSHYTLQEKSLLSFLILSDGGDGSV